MEIGVAIVTYNRLNKLKIAIDSFEKQVKLPQYIVVVNNASTDGTREFLSKWKQKDSNFKKIVINNEKNAGGSGGFYLALSEAIKYSANWIWVSDDDAYADKNALKYASEYLDKQSNPSNISAICGKVLNNGKIDISHRRNVYIKNHLFITERYIPENFYSNSEFYLNCFSYVGTILNKEKLLRVGLTNKDFIIWYDDSEHSLRLSKVGKIICLPKIEIIHDQNNGKYELDWKWYYGIRNRFYAYHECFDSNLYRATYLQFLIKAKLKCFIKDKRTKGLIELDALKDANNGILSQVQICV